VGRGFSRPGTIQIQTAGVQAITGIGPLRRVLVLTAALALLGASGHSSSLARPDSAQLTLWAWERPEDLRFLANPSAHFRTSAPPHFRTSALPHFRTFAPPHFRTFAPPHFRTIRVAFLDRTVRFEDGRIAVHYRHEPLLVSPGTPLMSVVRIETRGRAPEPSLADSTAALVVNAVHAPAVSALQIDFDARRSDRPFYSALLNSVRSNLPREIPLSITALASWCIDDPWIDTHDVDEIVPMLFQMGPDARHVLTRLEEDGQWPVAACNGAAGLATDELHDRLPPAQSIYVFNPRAWMPEDLRAVPER
jgi:hypothetical protein